MEAVIKKHGLTKDDINDLIKLADKMKISFNQLVHRIVKE